MMIGSAGVLQDDLERGAEGSRLWDLHAKKPLVKGTCKEGIQQVLMNQSQPQDTPAEAKPLPNTEHDSEHLHILALQFTSVHSQSSTCIR